MYECPNCGGELRFDIASQKLLCGHCKRTTEYTDLKEERRAGEDSRESAGSANIFRCPNCGGEVMSTNLTASDYCSYCGAFVMLERTEGIMDRADCIAPFKKTKEEVKELYRNAVSGRIYAPSAVKDPAFLDRFRGIYMPYWLYDVKLGPDICFTVKTAEQDGDYRVDSYHDLTCSSEILFDGVPYDASSTFRDNLGQAVTPFENDGMIPFTPAVMLGFFSDRADTPASAYEEDAMNAAADTAFDRIAEEAGFTDPKPHKPADKEELRKQMNARVEKIRSAFLPVWFLTWRKGDRVAYSVVNGQTGEVCAELPVDFGKYLLFSLLAAVPLFLLTQLFLTITPYNILFTAGVLAVLMGSIYNWQMKKVIVREMHGDDKGFLKANPEAEKRFLRRSKTIGSSAAYEMLMGVLTMLEENPGMLIIVVLFLAGLEMGDLATRVLKGGALLLAAVAQTRQGKRLSRLLSDRKAAAGILGTVTAAALAGVITLVRPVSDFWYYGGSVVSLAAVLISVFLLIRTYNLLVTSPVPRLFERNKGDGTEKRYSVFQEARRQADGADPAETGGPAEEADDFEDDGQDEISRVIVKGVNAAKAVGDASADTFLMFFDTLFKVFLGLILVFVVIFLIFAGAEVVGFADDNAFSAGSYEYQNEDTGFCTYLADDADLFSEEEEEALLQELIPITDYGYAGVVTAYAGSTDTKEFASQLFTEVFGDGASGTIFLIDMGNRNIWIESDGEVYRTVTKGYANIICDNVYTYAADGDYYNCASEALCQILTILEGGKIAKPMKVITGALLSLLLSSILNYFLVLFTVGVKAPGGAELAGGVIGAVAAANAADRIVRTERVYDPPSRSSGGSSGGGGGGGGGSSGGGGGHGF